VVQPDAVPSDASELDGSNAHRVGVAAQVIVADLDDPAGPLLDPASLHHLSRVLRLRAGETVCAADGMGGWQRCTFGGTERLEPTGVGGRVPAPAHGVTVAFVPVKGDRPELVVQKLTELGVDSIAVTSSERSVVRWDGERAEKHLVKLRRVALEATQQCRRLWLPTVEQRPLATLFEDGVSLADMGGAPVTAECRAIVVGPEGGWSDAERSLAATAGAASTEPVGLGEHVLRAETAAIAAGVLLTAMRR
jgi:16S rRNA (uracil1498-N3)-methyltransferase